MKVKIKYEVEVYYRHPGHINAEKRAQLTTCLENAVEQARQEGMLQEDADTHPMYVDARWSEYTVINED